MIAAPGCRHAFAWLAVTTVILFTAACDPPGKPKAEEAQADNRELIMDFRTLYESNCSGCHGTDGLNGAARTLNQPLYLAVLPKDSLHQIITYGRPGTAMPAWAKSQGGPLTDKQVNALVEGIYANWSKAAQVTGSNLPAYAATTEGDASHGKQLFARDCFMCHGKGAAVGPVTDSTYASLASNQYIRSAIIAGRPDLGMPDYRALNMGHQLSESDIADLTAYVASFRPPEITAQMQAPPGSVPGGQQAGSTGQHENESDSGQQSGVNAKGSEGSGNGPGSPRPQQRNEGNKGKGSSSQQGVK